MASPALSRRRFIAIAACAAALSPAIARAAGTPRVRWLGKALGAKAEIVLEHPDEAVAREALAEALAEVERLEAVLSLYRPDSALARLNRDGALAAPPADLVRVLGEAANIARLSDGAFDVTIQPLWALHADSLRQSGRLPSSAQVDAVRKLVDWRALTVSPDRIAFARPGMAATLNGIGQGYVTDRVAELLKRKGFANVLVDLGEPRVLGPRADGTAWPVSIRDPMLRGVALHRFEIADGAMATTEALGSSFPGFGR
ncbi:MAG TPA: FAD:protein FMN transferase, partial [Candidatus Omnitrophota bacterium]|nr:FAD:protein FMN transferase [Candidatus Omnitrophota bacterium]